MDEQPPPPDGIDESHERPLGGWRRHASPLSLLVFGAVVVIGMSGALGHERDWHGAANAAELRVHAPEVIRNGEFFEMRFHVESEERIDELVIGVEASLWEDLTVNTMIPEATDAESRDGELRFVFSGVEPATEFFWKVDLQINPDIVFGNEGSITVYDGEKRLVSTELSITVLP